jgi:hypothetical protein
VSGDFKICGEVIRTVKYAGEVIRTVKYADGLMVLAKEETVIRRMID